ncbi:hypothetical protein PRIPAC_81773, partial [Pristionchus pacificus]
NLQMLLRRPTKRLIKNVCIIICLILLFCLFRACRGTRSEDDSLIEQQCNEHHIVIVLGGYKTINLAMPLFKSLLFHHPGPLYFHFIADKRARRVIPTLFDTWELPSVHYSIYDLERHKDRVDWIPSKHYSSVYGLIRLAIPEILPDSVKEVLFLDTDLVVLNDISPIFDVFKGASDSAMLAMAENISPWYTKHKNHWPARGRGFNAGVIYLHLERARKANWTNLFTTAAKEGLTKFAYGHDQDILNALVVSRPEIVVQLPCEYNFQLASSAQPGKCQKEDRFVKIVHFNSPQKLKLRSKFVAHFARSFALFESMDGYIFRLREQCGQESEISTEFKDLKENDADCEELLEAIQTKYRTHLYFNNYVKTNTTDDITLVTHLTVDRFDAFNSVLESWEGPVSVAVYCTDAELSQIEKFMKATNMGRRRKNFAMHAVFKAGNYYPINYLRNVALNGSNTDFVYTADIDFIPSKGLYQNLRTLLNSKMKKKVLIVPAFESSTSINVEFPKTKESLVMEWNKGNMRPFGLKKLPADLNATGYGKWKESEFPFEVKWQPGYEMLTVIAREAAQLYDEQLVGYGWNNISNYSNLQNEGNQFLMIPSAFTIHRPHSSSSEISRYRASMLYTKCSKTLLSHFANNSNLRILAQNVTNLK